MRLKVSPWLNELTKVLVVTKTKGAEYFDSLEDAQKIYPSLDKWANGEVFTWATKDGERLRFEDWATERSMSC